MAYITVRPLEKRDVPACVRTIAENWDRSTAQNATNEFDLGLSTIAWRPQFYVAVEDQIVVGVAAYAPTWMDWDTWALTWVNVKASHQGRGIGKLIVQACLDDLAAIATAVVLTTHKPRYYDRWGFRDLTVLPDGSIMMLRS